jgi:nicotinamidase-related amidase
MRLDASASLLCVIDVQERLLAAMPDAPGLVARCRRLAVAARLLDVPTVLTEQYPRGLGRTPVALADALPPAIEKTSFSCLGCTTFAQAIGRGVHVAVLAGLETHVCIAQTALDLLARGLGVAVCVDAIRSRHAIDHEVALRRLEASGAVLVTTEAVLFEWCRTADHPRFQEVRRLVLDADAGLTAGS